MNLPSGNNSNKVAIFDIDGTLIKGRSSERIFFWYLVEKKIITNRDLMRYVWFFLKRLFGCKGVYVRRNKNYIRGKRYDLIVTEAQKCFDERIAPLISQKGLEEIRRLKQKGYRIILLTGTLDPLMERFKIVCGADEGIGTSLERENGIVTGEIDGIYAYHRGKTHVVESLVKEGGIDLDKSFAYANEKIDIDFMQLVGNPVAVNGDRGLTAHATRNNWRIVEFA